MKLYDCSEAPSPRRVRMFLAEKGIELPTVQVDLRAGEHRAPAFLAVNPEGVLPWLELDDGSGIGESMAICRYFEALQPEPPLFGRSPLQQAAVEHWSRRAELEGYLAAAEAFRNASPAFAGRGLPGSLDWPQIPALAERGRARVAHFHSLMDRRLRQVPWLAGGFFSVADITAAVSIQLAGWSGLPIPAHCPALARWQRALDARPSAAA